MNSIPKISALVVTYKQEVLIKRAIESLLKQRDFLYEICVSDDCSPDNTWDVLQEYSKLYPGLFRLHRNERNLGIFQNVEQSWLLPTGDLVYQLSGDDECPDGWFKAIVDYIGDNKIDYLNTRVCFYGDFKCQYPNGDFFIKSNKLVALGHDLVSLTVRSLVGNRSSCFSVASMKLFKNVSCGSSYVAEWAQEVQMPYFTEKAYYINKLGNIYYTRIGVNVHFDSKILKEREDNFPYMEQCLKEMGYTFCEKDAKYIYLQKLKYSLISKWSLSVYLQNIYFSISTEPSGMSI